MVARKTAGGGRRRGTADPGAETPPSGAVDVDVDTLDTGHLAQFAGFAWNERVLAGLRAAGHPRTKVAHGYVFQHLLLGPMTTSALAARMGVSQQAASKHVAALVRLGYVSRAAERADRRAKLLRLTKKAEDVIAKSRRLRAELEASLRREHGDAAVDAARAVLRHMLGDGFAETVRTRRVRG